MDELFGGAQWISGEPFDYGEEPAAVGYYGDHRNHVLSCDFELDASQAEKGATLGIAVLGYAKVRVNGQPLLARRVDGSMAEVELLGHWTNFSQCVYTDDFDISGLVTPGANTLEIELGNGFYNPAPITLFGKYNLRERLGEVGTPAAAAYVESADEVVARTDEEWACSEGNLLFNNVYLGERVDLGLAPSICGKARVLGPASMRQLEPNPCPPIVRTGEVAPVTTLERPDGCILDFGEMVAGFVELDFEAAAGQTLELIYAEELRDGELYVNSNVAGLVGLETPRGICPGGPGAPEPAVQRDVVRCAEGTNSYTPRFTCHSFRFVSVRGLAPDAITSAHAVYVHNDVADAGRFSCDNPDLMALLDAAVRTKRNNLHDVFEDCSRERFGYGGDMVSLATSNYFVSDVSGLLDKTLADFRRDQTARGGIPETAPFMGIGSNGPAYGEGPLLWQIAYPYLACVADRVYGRRDLLEREWEGIERFGDYLLSFDPAELAEHCLGDHGSIETVPGGFKTGTPDKELTGWCAILWGLECVREAAARLGLASDGTRFLGAAEDLRIQIRSRFAHADGTFGENTQTSIAFTGMLGLRDQAEAAEALAAKVREAGGVLATGIFGTMLAFELLGRTGHNDVIEAWLLRREEPSLLGMLASGSGALAEQFREELSSFDHAMFSSYAQWFYQGLGGIRVADDARGCDHVVVSPYFSPTLTEVSCSFDAVCGTIRVEWKREGGLVRLDLRLPASARVDFVVPKGYAVLEDREQDGLRSLVLEEASCR